jgi:uncharacterized membrane protein HdeD (DUF308 family)
MDVTLLRSIGRAWWLLALRGGAAIVFGVLALAMPAITLVTLVLFWGAWALVDGVTALWAGWQARDGTTPLWPFVLTGVLGIAAGVFTLVAPAVTAFALLMLIAVWAIVTGVLEISAAIRLRKEIDNEWWLILSGLLSVAFGALLVLRPGQGALALLWLIASFSIAFGVLMVLFAFKLKKHAGAAA